MDEGQFYSSQLEIVSGSSKIDFEPDGDLTKTVWGKAAPVTFEHDWMGRRHFPELETRVASLWTSEYFYFAFWCHYIDLNTFEEEDCTREKYGLWDRDVAEVFLSPDPARAHHYYEFEVAPDNKWIDLEVDLDREPSFDHAWDSHFKHATRIEDQAGLWTCEMRIPASSMGVQAIRPGWHCRVNFYRCDGPGDDTVRRFLAWSPTLCEKTSDFFHVPSRFGVIRFLS